MENNYQLCRIHNYIHGLMTKEEMYVLEREALDDPFLQDAIDGYRLRDGVDVKQLSLLQQRLSRRVEAQTVDRNKRFYSWQRLTIGLAAGVLFIVACSLVFFKFITNIPQKNTEVILMETQLRVKTEPATQNSASPVVGWDQFSEELNSELRDFRSNESLVLQFSVDNGLAKDIVVKGASSQKTATLIHDFVQDKVKWTGKTGAIQINIDGRK